MAADVTALSFTHDGRPQRVRFATGSAREAMAEEVAELGAQRVVVLASAREARRADRVLEDVPVVARFAEIVQHVPVATAEAARALAARVDADLVVSVGGGSATGLAKAVALTSGLPVVAVPTTYAGSEATAVWGLTEGHRKSTGVDLRVLPRVVVYDAALTTSLPVALTVASGLNALAHCVDALWAPQADPINAMYAQEATRLLAEALPAVVDASGDLPAREQLLCGAYLAAVAFSDAGSGLHHKICHVLGGRFDLPHASTHAVVLPYVLGLNGPYAPTAAARVAAALGADDALDGLRRLLRALDAPRSLREIGMPDGDLGAVAQEIVTAAPPTNPAPVTVDAVVRLLAAARDGSDPR